MAYGSKKSKGSTSKAEKSSGSMKIKQPKSMTTYSSKLK